MTQIEIDVEDLAKAKSKKRVWVKPTAQKKGHYREQEVGKKVPDVVGRTVPPSEMGEKAKMDKNVDRLTKLGVKTGDRVDLGNEVGVFIVKQVNADGTVSCGAGFGKRYPASMIKNVIKKKND